GADSCQNADKDAPPPPVVDALSIKHRLVLATLGDYAVRAEFKRGGKALVSEGTASIRLGVGGAYSIMDYDAAVEGQHDVGLGVSSVSADGKSLKEGGFGNFYHATLLVSGT